jgi:hypothetical protein
VIVLALWLEISVSIVLYCGEIVALLISMKAADAPATVPGPPEAASAAG